MNKKIKLIACDLDGTLLRFYGDTCSDRAAKLIGALIKKGVLFMPASGRQYPNLCRMFQKVDGEMMYLAENGALVMYQGKTIDKRYFSRELGLRISHAIQDKEECEVLISGEETSYIIPKSDAYTSYIRDEVGNNITIIDKPEDIKEDIMKVSFYTKACYREAVIADLQPKFDKECLIVTSGHEWVDFAPLGTSKGSALDVIGRKYHILPEEMAAFGDNENDRTMLEYVGYPYLMTTGNPSMKDISSIPCECVEDELEKILLSL